MKIIRKEDIKISDWSGGKTSELFIYPPKSNYKKLDFLFRLSKATIEVEESNFTPLPNVKRKLMVLEGELELVHEGHHSKRLKSLEFDTFFGDWKTKSIGVATDLNLMTLGDTKGDFSIIKAKKTQFHTYKIPNDFTVFYNCNGKLHFDEKILNEGELLIFDSVQEDSFKFKLDAGSNIIVVRINL